MSSTPEHTQAPRTAWINAMRAEVLRVGKRIPEVARVVAVGVWIATYADADGTNAFPGRETLACLAGCSQETVTRSVKVLVGVGVLQRKRRPNASAMYVLLHPTGPLPWEEHLHHYTQTRQRKAHARKKAEALARKASMDAVRTASTAGVPDSVHDGGSDLDARGPDSVHGRPRTASTDAFRTASTAGPYKCPPTYGRDPRIDKERVADSPQPPVRAGARGDEKQSPSRQQPEDKPVKRCIGGCGQPLLRADRDRCHGCQKRAEGAPERPQQPVQGAFLMSVPSGTSPARPDAPGAPSWPQQDPAAPLRTCGCGRQYRDRHPGGVCPDCQMAAAVDHPQHGRAVSGA
ncbi:hypothetical protein PH213_20595 [Streptomyces sp. SRF1]|uniref:hypothetical protein n=1 Tax=Streptomyces sp. SRF1 TaxID=1549642 RepID=UPI0025AF4E5F|nr:hypothetical protein [Streptomyces sp. SRF1]MDN3056906.1 hypothetical protein [Streptomyces sp. SRF1]